MSEIFYENFCERVEKAKYPEYKSKICAKGVFRSARHKLEIIILLYIRQRRDVNYGKA